MYRGWLTCQTLCSVFWLSVALHPTLLCLSTPNLVLKTTVYCSSSPTALGADWAQMGSPCSDGGRGWSWSCGCLGWAGCTQWVTRHLSSRGFSMPSRGLPHSVESQGSQTPSMVAGHLQVRSCVMNSSFHTWHTGQTNWNVTVCSRERGIAGLSKENKQLMLRKVYTPQWFGGKSFIGKFGVRAGSRLCSRNLVLSLKLASSTWVRGFWAWPC